MEFLTYDEKMCLKQSLYHYTFNTITYRQSTTKNITVQENDDHCTIPLHSFFKLYPATLVILKLFVQYITLFKSQIPLQYFKV
jgi:hypothetical protein